MKIFKNKIFIIALLIAVFFVILVSVLSLMGQTGAIKDALKAVELLGRMQGAFLDRSQVELSGAVPIVIKDDL